MTDDGRRREWRAPFPLDVRLVLGVHRRGGGDPAYRAEPDGAIWRTSLTPDGPATLRVTAAATPAPSGAYPSGASPSGASPSGADPAGADPAGADPAGADPSGADPSGADPAEAAGADPAGAAGAGEAGADRTGAGTLVVARAWGPGADWILAALPDLLGARDEPGGFRPEHPLLRDAVRRHPGFRVGRSGRVLEALVPAVLEQKVVGLEAFRSWRLLLRRFGLPAPGPAPAGMRVCPPASTWAAIPSWEWHRAGAEGIRAATIRAAARVAGRLEQLAALPAAEADRKLQSLSGVGVWTSAEVRQRACGDPDAVSVGDYNLPGAVGWALAGRVVDDAGMLELLAPYAGHRYRATRLIELTGIRPPRRGPRNSVRDYRAI